MIVASRTCVLFDVKSTRVPKLGKRSSLYFDSSYYSNPSLIDAASMWKAQEEGRVMDWRRKNLKCNATRGSSPMRQGTLTQPQIFPVSTTLKKTFHLIFWANSILARRRIKIFLVFRLAVFCHWVRDQTKSNDAENSLSYKTEMIHVCFFGRLIEIDSI